MATSMPDHFNMVNDALRWVWEDKHGGPLGTRPSEIAFMWLRLSRWLRRQHYTVQDGERALIVGDNTRWYVARGDRLFRRSNYEGLWNLSLHPLSDELRIVIREARQAGALPGGPGIQPEDRQAGDPAPQEDIPIDKPDSAEIGRWLERWLQDGERVSTSRCWNCRWFALPLSGDHYCQKFSSPVDCLGVCREWDARRTA